MYTFHEGNSENSLQLNAN